MTARVKFVIGLTAVLVGLLIFLLIYMFSVVRGRTLQGRLKNAAEDVLGPDYLQVDMIVPENKVDESVFNGQGQQQNFVGEWDVFSVGIKNYTSGMRDDNFLDHMDVADFRANSVVVFWQQIKGKRMNVIKRSYEVRDGTLLLMDSAAQWRLEFGFLEDGNKLALRTKNITMILRKRGTVPGE